MGEIDGGAVKKCIWLSIIPVCVLNCSMMSPFFFFPLLKYLETTAVESRNSSALSLPSCLVQESQERRDNFLLVCKSLEETFQSCLYRYFKGMGGLRPFRLTIEVEELGQKMQSLT